MISQSETVASSHATGEQESQRPNMCHKREVGGGGRIALEGQTQPQRAIVLAQRTGARSNLTVIGCTGDRDNHSGWSIVLQL